MRGKEGVETGETTSMMKERKSTTNIGASLTWTSGIKMRAANKAVTQNANTSLYINMARYRSGHKVLWIWLKRVWGRQHIKPFRDTGVMSYRPYVV